MRTVFEWLKDELDIDMPKGDISGEWFAENNLPMIVHCTCCEMTMALPSAMVDDNGNIYCPSCVD